MKKVIMVSGGFDPPHIGHTRMFTEAAEWGEVVVALNSDDWLIRKKGYAFMAWEERAELIQQFESVDRVVPFNDDDNTACDALITIKPDASIIFLACFDEIVFSTATILFPIIARSNG